MDYFERSLILHKKHKGKIAISNTIEVKTKDDLSLVYSPGVAAIVATGRSDYPNQVNNVLAFPGIFRGAIDARASQITPQMKIRKRMGITTPATI